MKNKTNWINIGISAGVYVLWAVITLLLSEIEAVSDLCILITLPLLLAGCVYVVYRSGRVMLFPVTSLACHVTACALAIISVYLELDAIINTPPDEQSELLVLFTAIGGSLLFGMFIIAAVASAAVLFLLTVLTALISKKIFDKNRSTV